jgi:hypothetical protein
MNKEQLKHEIIKLHFLEQQNILDSFKFDRYLYKNQRAKRNDDYNHLYFRN